MTSPAFPYHCHPLIRPNLKTTFLHTNPKERKKRGNSRAGVCIEIAIPTLEEITVLINIRYTFNAVKSGLRK